MLGQPVAKITENKLADFEDNPELLKSAGTSEANLGKGEQTKNFSSHIVKLLIEK